MYNEVESRGATVVTFGGCSCGFILFIVFLILKLTHVIDWSWFWVVFPLWIGPAVVLAIAIIVGIVAGIAYIIDNRRY